MLDAIQQFEITFTGGFAIVSALMWIAFVAYFLFIAYHSRLLTPLRKTISSLIVLVQPRKQRKIYENLYSNGYIYNWSRKMCQRKWDKGL